MSDEGCTLVDCPTKEWHKYHCPQCGVGLHSWTAHGNCNLGFCLDCFNSTVLPALSRQGQQLYLCCRLAGRWGVEDAWNVGGVQLFYNFGLVPVVRAMWQASKRRKGASRYGRSR